MIGEDEAIPEEHIHKYGFAFEGKKAYMQCTYRLFLQKSG